MKRTASERDGGGRKETGLSAYVGSTISIITNDGRHILGTLKGFDQVQNLAFIHFDVLPKVWEWTGNLLLEYGPRWLQGEIGHSIVFVLAFMGVQQVLSVGAARMVGSAATSVRW